MANVTEDSTQNPPGQDDPSSILTKRQREWLLEGGAESDEGADRAMKSRVRDRVRMGIFDMALLADHYPLEEFDKALAEPDSHTESAMAVPPVEDAISALAAVIYLRARDVEREIGQQEDGRGDGWRTAAHVRGGIEQALSRIGVAAESIDVNIEIDRGSDLETVAEEGDLSAVGRKQLAKMRSEGLITDEEYSEEMGRRVLGMGFDNE